VTFAASPTLPLGTYVVQLVAAGPFTSRPVQIDIDVVASDFTITPRPGHFNIRRGTSTTVRLDTSITPAGEQDLVLSLAAAPPPGISINLPPAMSGGGSANMVVTVGPNAVPGFKSVFVLARNGVVTRLAPLSFVVE
jgi:hypothetical protein